MKRKVVFRNIFETEKKKEEPKEEKAMPEKKICPLTHHTGAYGQGSVDFSFCVEKKCAWWDDFTGYCAILNISKYGSKGTLPVIEPEAKE